MFVLSLPSVSVSVQDMGTKFLNVAKLNSTLSCNLFCFDFFKWEHTLMIA